MITIMPGHPCFMLKTIRQIAYGDNMKIEFYIKKFGLENEVIKIRRHLHRIAELSGQEEKTAEYICSLLDSWGVNYTANVAGKGVVAVVKGAEDGKVVALRADMDALPIEEETRLPYASEERGVMHACGHDAHTAILLGCCHIFSLIKEDLSGTVKFFFQPAEETTGGAERMIEQGCMTNPDVDYVVGLHVEPSLHTGMVGIRFGKMYAASDMVDICIKGKGAHGAHPDEGIDTIVVAANIINTVQTVISRNLSPLESGVCTFGSIKGGTVRNQLADRTELSGIIRSFDENTRQQLRERIKLICEGIGKSMGARIDFNITESYGPLINDDTVTSTVKNAAERIFGKNNVVIEQKPDLSCEDFSYFANMKPSCYFHLGCYDEKLGDKVDLHHPKFTVDENCLILGVKIQVENVISLLNLEEK